MIGAIDIIGGQEREFQVWVDRGALEAHGLAVTDVIAALGTQNVEIPGGRVETGPWEYVIRTQGQVFSAAELSLQTLS